MNNYLGKEFHRKSALDANKDDKRQANARLHEAIGNQSLQEWFNKEKKKPAPKAEDAEKKQTPAKPAKKDYDPECIICQNEGPRDNNNGRHQHVYPGQE